MQHSEMELLSGIYNHYLKTKSRECSVSFTDSNLQEKFDKYNSLEYLEECGLIYFTARTMGFWQFKITVEGIKFVENGFKEPASLPVIQDANSIYNTGSANPVSNNYNQISVDISQSDIPEGTKKLINTLLYEMKNPYHTPGKKAEKIKAFISDITSDTVTGTTASGLTVLLTSLFNQIQL